MDELHRNYSQAMMNLIKEQNKAELELYEKYHDQVIQLPLNLINIKLISIFS